MNMTLVDVQSADNRLITTLKMLGAKTHQQILPILSELRFVILAAIITGFSAGLSVKWAPP